MQKVMRPSTFISDQDSNLGSVHAYFMGVGTHALGTVLELQSAPLYWGFVVHSAVYAADTTCDSIQVIIITFHDMP
jgi:hypothetical protein